jgi:hypothetical protein
MNLPSNHIPALVDMNLSVREKAAALIAEGVQRFERMPKSKRDEIIMLLTTSCNACKVLQRRGKDVLPNHSNEELLQSFLDREKAMRSARIEERIERLEQSPGCVYIIKCKNYIKIGFSTEFDKRLDSFKTDNPFPVSAIHVIDNVTVHVERQLHERFKRLRHQGEWFRYTGSLKRWIEQGCPL